MKQSVRERVESINKGIIPEGYKKTKVGIVPVEWDRYKLSDISEELTERAGNNEYETLSISAGIGFVNQANKFGKELSGKQYEKYIVLRKGDFSYNKGNSKKYPQGCIYQLKDRDEAAVPNVFESFRFNKGINDYYEQLFVSGFLNRQLFAKINHGVRDDGLLNLKGEDFYSCYVPFPSLPEQQKIAEILSTQDKLIELQEKKIEQLKELKKAYLQKMFPKNGSKYPELRFKGFTDPWEQRKLSECAGFRRGSFPQPYGNGEWYDGEGAMPFVQVADVSDDMKLVNETKQKISKLAQPMSVFAEKGSVLVTLQGSIGRVAITQYGAFVDRTVLIFDNYNQKICKTFWAYIIREKFVEEAKKAPGGTIKTITKEVLSDFDLILPNYDEQQRIGDFFSNLDTLINLHQRKSEQEKQKKKALLQLLLTGKVRCI